MISTIYTVVGMTTAEDARAIKDSLYLVQVSGPSPPRSFPTATRASSLSTRTTSSWTARPSRQPCRRPATTRSP